jgi:hypothetical protein
MSKHLAIAMRTRAPVRAAGRGKGWPPERRVRQAARARLMQPWRHSTGPRTEAGKARVAMNALRHGERRRAWLEKAQRIRRAIRLCANTVLLVRMLVRERDRPAPPALRMPVDQRAQPSNPPPPGGRAIACANAAPIEGALDQRRACFDKLSVRVFLSATKIFPQPEPVEGRNDGCAASTCDSPAPGGESLPPT